MHIDSNSHHLKMFYSKPNLGRKEKDEKTEKDETGKASVDDCKTQGGK